MLSNRCSLKKPLVTAKATPATLFFPSLRVATTLAGPCAQEGTEERWSDAPVPELGKDPGLSQCKNTDVWRANLQGAVASCTDTIQGTQVKGGTQAVK